MSAPLTPEDAADQPELIPAGTVQPVRVTAYRTSDGRIFETRPAAEAHEAERDLALLAEQIEDDVEEIGTALLERAVPLHAILTRLLKAREKMQAPAGAEAVS